MKNKSKKIYGRLSALFLSVVLIMTGLSVTASAAGENLISTIPYFDPTFDNIDLSKVTRGLTLKHAELVTDETTGNKYMQIKQVDGENGSIEIRVSVEPEKNYNFSFKMRNSLANALQLGACKFYADNPANGAETEMSNISSGYIDYKNGNYITAFGNGLNYSPTIDEERNKFGIARSGGDENIFREITINFTTPPKNANTNVKNVKLVLECLQDDPMLAVDDFSVVETGKKPNRVFNGDFEALQNDKSIPEASGIFYTKGADASFELLTESNGNHYIQGITKAAQWSIDSKTAGVLYGQKSGTRYKMSFRAKTNNDVSGTPKVSIKLTNDKNVGGTYEFTSNPLSNEWKTYTAYINFTEPARDNQYIAGGKAQFALTSDKNNKICVDDVYTWYDEDSIGFYELLSEEAELNQLSTAMASYGNVIKKEASIEATNIAALTANGDRSLKVRAHYLPKLTWGEYDSSNKKYPLTVEGPTEITLLSAVYKHEGNKKTLISVDIESGTTQANGESLDIVGEVTVPKATNGETYTVEAMAWDMDGMKPVMDKAVLN